MPRPAKRARLEVADSEVQKVEDLKEYQLTDMGDAEVFYVPDFVDKTVAAEWYTELLKLDSCKFLSSIFKLANKHFPVRVST